MKIFFMNTKENSPLHFSHHLLQIYLTGTKLFIILIAALPSLPISSLSWWLILSVKCEENHHNKRTGKIWSRTLIPLVRETSKHITCLLSMFIYIFLFSYFFFFFFFKCKQLGYFQDWSSGKRIVVTSSSKKD